MVRVLPIALRRRERGGFSEERCDKEDDERKASMERLRFHWSASSRLRPYSSPPPSMLFLPRQTYDISQLGIDQRKVNMLVREYCDDIKRKNKPIILSHHMLPVFKEVKEKMSKSDPLSAIFMEDDEVLIIFSLH